jgi:hypothetical protein
MNSNFAYLNVTWMSVPLTNEPCYSTVCGLQEENKRKIRDRREGKVRMERQRLRSKRRTRRKWEIR